MILEIAFGILLGYLLIISLPHILDFLVSMLSIRNFFIATTIIGYAVFFLEFKESKLISLTGGLFGLFSLGICEYLSDSKEDEERSLFGFFRWIKKHL